MTKPIQKYDAPGITVTFDPSVCTHSGRCVRGLPTVFNIRERRWIRPEQATVDEVVAQVGQCPSGALQVVRTSTP